MKQSDIQNVIKGIVCDLIDENYQKVYKDDYKKLLTADEIKEGIEDYPGKLTLFPNSAFDLMRVYRNFEDSCDVDFPLWYNNQRSDLTLVCNIKYINGTYGHSIEGILVQ